MENAIQATNDYARPTSVAIAVVERDDLFLIGQRPPSVVLAGFWEFPGGKVHDGEIADQAAVRECREEAGIEVQVTGKLGERIHSYDFGPVHLHFFVCHPMDVSKQPRPPFRWVQRHELSRYRFPPANEELLEMLQSTTALQGRPVSRSAVEGRPTAARPDAKSS